MCCGQLAAGRFSEGKLLQKTRLKVAPQSPERKLWVGGISERCRPGRHLTHCFLKAWSDSNPTQRQGSAGFVQCVREAEAAATIPNLHLTQPFFESFCSLTAACSTTIAQNVYQCTTVAKDFNRMTVVSLAALQFFLFFQKRKELYHKHQSAWEHSQRYKATVTHQHPKKKKAISKSHLKLRIHVPNNIMTTQAD